MPHAASILSLQSFLYIDVSKDMCIQTAEITNDGEDISAALANNLRSSDLSVITHHSIETARMLTK